LHVEHPAKPSSPQRAPGEVLHVEHPAEEGPAKAPGSERPRRSSRSSTPYRWPWGPIVLEDDEDERQDEQEVGVAVANAARRVQGASSSVTVDSKAGPAAEVTSSRQAAPMVRRPRFERAQIMAVANQKGGVGKTTTSVSLAAAIAETGAAVLLVDLDPQGNASSGLGMQPGDDDTTIYHVLIEDAELVAAIKPTQVANLHVAPTTIDLAGAEIELVSVFSREHRLARALASVRDDYDVIVIDCPPSLGLLTVNALTAADGVIVPIQCEYYALEGLGALRRNVDLVRANLNPSLDIIGFALTMLDARTRLSQQVVEEVQRHFGDRVFATTVPRSVRLAEAPSFGEPITVFDSGSRGAVAYRRLAGEVLDRLTVPTA
jgi:chromosome partitioning protein